MAIKFSDALSVVLIVFCCINIISSAPKCDRVPEGTSVTKSPPDGRFRLRISTDPQYYIPGETYNITLEGVTRFASPTTQKFTAFFITSETIGEGDSRWSASGYDDDAGRFAIIQPATSKISEKCPNLIVNTNSVSKSEVTVQWTAPSSSGRGCIVIRSTVIEHRDVWFMDDGALSKTLCEDEADASEIEQFITQQCTACAEAKYELTFEGLWSRNTHPKDFPDDGWLTKFSDIIGASHTYGDPFWKYGAQATPGMKEVAEHGATQTLELELKQKGEDVRTIIKARGISYPNVNGKTFAVFRVDAQHHLISLVSKIYPSPDWFVGIHDFELCTPNGQWIEHKEIKLYPYDAGTDSGPTYTSPDQPTYPAEAIRRIRPNNPNDPRSPFYDPENKEMKPLAKLYITRQRLYEKTCDDDDENGHEDSRNGYGEEEEEDNGNSCATTEWGSWSECNNPCGEGRKTRRRFYAYPEKAHRSRCQEKLEDHRDCVGKKCPQNRDDNRDFNRESNRNSAEDKNNDPDDEDEVPSSDPTCEMTEWSDEGCTCDNGQKREHRTFKRNLKVCKKRYPNVKLERLVNCGNSDCPSGRDETTRRNPSSCHLSKWSKWSKCSSYCFGQSIRVRRPEHRHLLSEENLRRVAEVYTKIQNRNEFEEDILGLNFTSVQNPDHDCAGEKLVESKRCNQDHDDECMEEDNDTDGPPKICLHPPMRGNCGMEPDVRYFYNKLTNDCGQFIYTGCEGSKNDFDTYNQCRETCVVDGDDDIEAEPQTFDLVSKQRRERIDCELTPWKYTACNASCGEGYRWKYRDVSKRPQNGGRVCPTKLRQLERCHVMECQPKASNNDYYNKGRYYPVTRWTTVPTTQVIRCEYSEWSAWSPCSKSCGTSSIKIRTRTLLNYQNSQYCNERIEEKQCEVLPCLAGYHNYRNHHPYY